MELSKFHKILCVPLVLIRWAKIIVVFKDVFFNDRFFKKSFAKKKFSKNFFFVDRFGISEENWLRSFFLVFFLKTSFLPFFLHLCLHLNYSVIFLANPNIPVPTLFPI